MSEQDEFASPQVEPSDEVIEAATYWNKEFAGVLPIGNMAKDLFHLSRAVLAYQKATHGDPRGDSESKSGYARGMEDAAKIVDGTANLYKAYADRSEKNDPVRSVAMFEHYRTCWGVAHAIRAAKEK